MKNGAYITLSHLVTHYGVAAITIFEAHTYKRMHINVLLNGLNL